MIVRETHPVRVHDIDTDPRRYGFPPHHPAMHSLLGVPVGAKGRSIGRLYLTNKLPSGDFTEDDERLVEMFALHAGIAIENARLHEQVQRLAIVEERERIGRDLHDGIIQSIYAVGLSLEDVPDLFEDEPDVARARVERAIDSLDQSIRDIRNFIFGLRPELLEQAGLIGGLAALADEFRVNSMVDIDLDTAVMDESELRAGRHRPAPVHRPRGAEQHRPPLQGDPAAASTWSSSPRSDRSRSPTTASASTGRSPAARGHQGLVNMSERASSWAADSRFRASRRSARVSSCRYPAATVERSSGSRRRMTDQIEARPLRLLVVDDHEVVRQGLVSLLDRREHFQVVAEAGTAAEAVEMARKFEPDLVVMDVRLPDGSGIEACREIRAELPDTRVVILTSYPDEEAVLSAIIAGASGYLLKQIRGRDLVSALESVGRGESLLDPAVTEKVLDRVRRIATGTYTDELAPLTPQEQKILLLVAEGKTNKEIASGGLPVRQDGQELRQLDPLQAQPGAARPGRRLRGQAPHQGRRLSRERAAPAGDTPYRAEWHRRGRRDRTHADDRARKLPGMQIVSAEEAVAGIQSGQQIFVHGAAATPTVLLDALVRRAPELQDVKIVHLHAEGPRPHLAPEMAGHFCHLALFIGPNAREAINEGRAEYIPVFLSDIPRLFDQRPPAARRGPHQRDPARRARLLLARHVGRRRAGRRPQREDGHRPAQPSMPRTLGDSFVHVSEIDLGVEVDVPPYDHAPGEIGEVERRIGEYVADLVQDEATLQMGIGAIPTAVGLRLYDKRDLGIHTEMFTDVARRPRRAGRRHRRAQGDRPRQDRDRLHDGHAAPVQVRRRQPDGRDAAGRLHQRHGDHPRHPAHDGDQLRHRGRPDGPGLRRLDRPAASTAASAARWTSCAAPPWPRRGGRSSPCPPRRPTARSRASPWLSRRAPASRRPAPTCARS